MKLMLQHDPAQRPTADAILQSHLMPPRSEIEVAYLEEAVKVFVRCHGCVRWEYLFCGPPCYPPLLLQSISKPHGPFFTRLLSELFQQTTREQLDLTYEPDVDPFDMGQTMPGQALKHQATVRNVVVSPHRFLVCTLVCMCATQGPFRASRFSGRASQRVLDPRRYFRGFQRIGPQTCAIIHVLHAGSEATSCSSFALHRWT
jgi:hypothetical protein